MGLERLRAAKKKAVGTNQAVKAIERGVARVAFVAKDADPLHAREVLAAAQSKDIEVIYADSMAALGKACGIAVGAVAAVIIEY